MSKKTIKVSDLVNKVNNILQHTTPLDFEYANGLRTLLEFTLHQTENYNGFRYLEQREVPENELPGIRFTDGEPDFSNTDANRVKYY